MISGLLLVIGIAVLCYLVIPEISLQIRSAYRRKLLSEFKAAAVSIMKFSSMNPDGTLFCKTGTQTLRLDPQRARFFLADSLKGLEEVNWKSVHLLIRGTSLLVYQGSDPKAKILCILSGKDGYGAKLPENSALFTESRSGNPVKIVSVALAVFAEFLLFLHFSADPMMRNVAIAALIGIFGEVLPYSPPGLFLTIASTKYLQSDSGGKGFISGTLFALGIIVNVSLIFFLIRLIAFGSLL